VEVQVVGDTAGRVAALGDRDCSVQRRRQKLVEEARRMFCLFLLSFSLQSPAWWLPASQRAAMAAEAEAVCARAKYHTAGTVEFLVDMASGRHYFLEVNTRLQVEHTVTEEVLDIDLVRLQILTACGAPLSSLALRGPRGSGHALQVTASLFSFSLVTLVRCECAQRTRSCGPAWGGWRRVGGRRACGWRRGWRRAPWSRPTTTPCWPSSLSRGQTGDTS
jgi:hypothetical protein